MNALFKLVLSSILAKRVKFFYLHPRLGGGAQCVFRIIYQTFLCIHILYTIHNVCTRVCAKNSLEFNNSSLL